MGFKETWEVFNCCFPVSLIYSLHVCASQVGLCSKVFFT